MFFMEIIGLHFENHTKPINTLEPDSSSQYSDHTRGWILFPASGPTQSPMQLVLGALSPMVN
jgi:hypothetical protein